MKTTITGLSLLAMALALSGAWLFAYHRGFDQGCSRGSRDAFLCWTQQPKRWNGVITLAGATCAWLCIRPLLGFYKGQQVKIPEIMSRTPCCRRPSSEISAASRTTPPGRMRVQQQFAPTQHFPHEQAHSSSTATRPEYGRIILFRGAKIENAVRRFRRAPLSGSLNVK